MIKRDTSCIHQYTTYFIFLIQLFSSIHNYKTNDNFCLFNITQTHYIMNILDKFFFFPSGVQYSHWSLTKLGKALLNKGDSVLKKTRTRNIQLTTKEYLINSLTLVTNGLFKLCPLT